MTRRKEVPCALCKNLTLRENGVCWTCEHTYEIGKNEIRRREEVLGKGDTRSYLVTRFPRFLHNFASDTFEFKHHGMFSWHEETEVLDIILNMIGARRSGSRSDERVGFFRGQSSDHNDRSFLLTEDQAEAIDRLCELLRQLAKHSYQEGRSDGQRFLTKLAAGQVSFAELNKL